MADEDKKKMGQIIRQARKNLKMTQKQLGIEIGYSEASAERIIQHWEAGSQPVPLEQLKSLAKILKTTIENLLP